MSYLDKVQVGSTTYDLKDTAAHAEIGKVKNLLAEGGVYGNVVEAVLKLGKYTASAGALVWQEATVNCATEYVVEDGQETGAPKAVIVEPGTVFHLTDPDNYYYRGYYSDNNGTTWTSLVGNWTTNDITTPDNRQRQMVLMIRKRVESAITEEEVAGKLQIILPQKFPTWGTDFYKNFSVAEQLSVGGWLDPANGVGKVANGYVMSHFIPVKAGQVIKYRLTSTKGCAVTAYNGYLEYVGHADLGEGSYTVTADGFVRFSAEAGAAGLYVYFDDYGIPDKTGRRLKAINNTLDVLCTDYMKAGVERIKGELKEKAELGNTVVFGFNTDQHIVNDDHENYEPKTTAVLRGMKAMSMLSHEYPHDFICLGGDACNSAAANAGTLEEILSQCITVQEPLYDAWCPVVPLVGNHESIQNNRNITNEMLYNVYLKRIVNSGFFPLKNYAQNADFSGSWNGVGCNGVWDSAAHQIRFIFFDDCSLNVSEGPARKYGSTARNNALSNMLAGTPTGYNIIILSHHPLSQDLTDTKWKNPCACQSILANYAERIICCVCGHSHADVSEVSDGILYIGTTMSQYGTDLAGNTSTPNTVTETAFDTFMIDQDSHKIYAFRYGKGQDREWSYWQS